MARANSLNRQAAVAHGAVWPRAREAWWRSSHKRRSNRASVRDGLVVLAARRGNTRHGFPDVGRAVIARDVTQRNNTHQPLVLIDDRQAPDAGLAHVSRHGVDFVGVETIEHFPAHDGVDLGLHRPALSYRTDDNIAVGDHAHQAIVCADRQRAGVDFGHEARRLANGVVRVHQAYIACDYFADFHRFTSMTTTCGQRVRSGGIHSDKLWRGPHRYKSDSAPGRMFKVY